MQLVINRSSYKSILIAFIVALLLPVFVARNTQAATLSRTLVRFDRMKISTATTGTICANPATTAVEATTVVAFPAGYTLGAAATFTVNTTNLAWPAGGTAWPGIGTATTVAGQAVTFPSGDLTVGTLYCFNWINTAAVTVSATATANNQGSVTTRTNVPAVIDTGAYATASIADEQILITASVPTNFSMTISANTDPLGALSTGVVTTSPTPRTITVNTNAKNGWLVWAKDSNTGLNSVNAAKTIASTTPGANSTLAAGAEGYNMGVTSSQVAGSGTITVATAFVGGTIGRGGGLNTAFQSLASSSGTARTAVLTLTNNAAIADITPAATDYTDTVTLVGAGLF